MPESVAATIAEFDQGSIVLLPGRFQHVPGRRIVGMSVTVKDLDAAARVLGGRARRAAAGRLLVGPADALGYWLEFRGARQ